LISNWLSLVALVEMQNAQKPSDYPTVVIQFMFSNAADVGLCIFAMVLVRSLSRLQLRAVTNAA
jgi:hypothetical protein